MSCAVISGPWLNRRDNRWQITIDGVQKYYSHYVWFLNTGHWPDFENKREVIHHRNGDPSDNRFENLEMKNHSSHISEHKIGVPRSPETRAKMSAANKGEKNPSFGRSPSKETRTKIKASWILEKREKHSIRMRGDNNPNWKGDNATPHAKYMRIWYKKRRAFDRRAV